VNRAALPSTVPPDEACITIVWREDLLIA
jgi:tRNA(Ile)-lysidine synthase